MAVSTEPAGRAAYLSVPKSDLLTALARSRCTSG
jgi:hypothetical protein